jgi:UDP-N-acetylglucosamine acyltransferase
MDVHPTAIIHDGARLGADVSVGPYCVVGPLVRLGDRCRLHAHVVIDGDTHIGHDTEIWPYASIGYIAQDKKLTPDSPMGALRIGAHNKIREYVTISPGTPKGTGVTKLGDHNMLLIGSHIGHDAELGSHIVMTNGSMTAGHTTIADRAILGAMVGVHQFCRVGRLVMLAAGAMCSKDAPPFAMVHGDRARIRGVNVIGMRRAGMSLADVAVVKRAYRLLFWRSEVISSRLEKVRATMGDHPLVNEILEFIEGTKRGVLMARGGRADLGDERDADPSRE